jgi:hypothetical protein
MTTLVTQKLQSSGTADYTVAEVDSQIEEELKEYSTYNPHLVPIVFKIESRYGTVSSTTASGLIDANKGQFLATDTEKVVHNTTDNTRAVISSFTSTAQVGLTRDIMALNENYRIYNKQCWNERQIYLGDVPENYIVDSVEYPIGQRRNFKIADNVLELNVDAVPDSNAGSTIRTPADVDVLVRFNKPHVLSQLTDWVGNVAATVAAGATTLSASALQAAGTIEVGEEFTIQYHRSTYIVAAQTTIASNTAAVSFYPPLEAAVAATTQTITFRMSSLTPRDEDVFADLTAARLAVNKAPKFINSVVIGAPNAWSNILTWGERKLGQTLRKLEAQTAPKVKKQYPTE